MTRSVSATEASAAVTATTDYGKGSTALRTVGQERDADGHRTAVVSTGGAQTFTYTPRATLASVNNGGGTTRTLTFDAFERKTTDSGVTYSYDPLDRVQTRGSTTFTYDGGSNNLATDGTSTRFRLPRYLSRGPAMGRLAPGPGMAVCPLS